MSYDKDFNNFKDNFYNLLSQCNEIKKNDANDYLVKKPLPILDNEGFLRLTHIKKINFKYFLLNNNSEITNSKYFKDNEDFLFNYNIFIEFLINKKIIKTKELDRISKIDLIEYLKGFVKHLLLNYLEFVESFEFSDEKLYKIWLAMNNFLTTEHVTHYYFIPLYGLQGNFDILQLSSTIEIKPLTPEHYCNITDLDITHLDKPDKRYWRLRYGIFLKIKERDGVIPNSVEIYKEIQKVIISFRLMKAGDIFYGAIYPYSEGIWKERSIPPRIGSENPPDKIRVFDLKNHELESYISLFKELTSIDLNKDSNRYINTALRRFNGSYHDIYLEDKITNLIIALECLLTSGPGELQIKLSLRGALLLGKDENQREFLSRIIKKCYEVRSAIVHGKKRKSVIIDNREYNDLELLLELEKITRQILISIIKLTKIYKLQNDLINRLDESIINRNKIIEIPK